MCFILIVGKIILCYLLCGVLLFLSSNFYYLCGVDKINLKLLVMSVMMGVLGFYVWFVLL